MLAALADLFIERGLLTHIKSDNGSKFIATVVQEWLSEVSLKTLYISPGSPWKNGYNGSFNGSLADELLSGEIFHSLSYAPVLIEHGGGTTALSGRTAASATDHGPRSGDTAIAGLRFLFAPPTTSSGGGGDELLINNPDHPVGAAQS